MEKTLLLIKPDAVERNLIGKILSIIENEGFEIIDMEMENITREKAEAFYSVHKDRHFFSGLVDYIVSGKTVIVLLQRDDAILYLRKIVGRTNPINAVSGTIRNMFGQTLRRNSVHASDSKKSADYESQIFFKENI